MGRSLHLGLSGVVDWKGVLMIDCPSPEFLLKLHRMWLMARRMFGMRDISNSLVYI